MDLIKSVCTAKEMTNKGERQFMEWEKISTTDISDKGLMSKIYKQLIQVSMRKTKQLNTKWQRCGEKGTIVLC